MPEAEPHVARLRQRFDPTAPLGVPAHITLLYPFMSPECINEGTLERVRAVAASVAAFSFRLSRIGRFPEALYLAPEPSGPLVALTQALVRQFPEFPPYGGQYESVVPHLTVAQVVESRQGPIEAELRASLPRSGAVVATCTEFAVIENSTGRWEPMCAFPLA